ncbi:trypsin-like serine protease [Bdellovibrio sp. SKB1291214]|uniref:trypsin-like serine protease n=1 Tax=Bdellovibrio sp. SKB1291214 TaxID=1732569 RepID=UPI000B51526C|nr:trypsin-like serine protease [Bdellovibrio sp. SKB1291214]UYL08730.1 trypsin-like serine protease [Bdellovibrio sp. SKB1291214]
MRKSLVLLSLLALAACAEGGFQSPQPIATTAKKSASTTSDTIIGGEVVQPGSDVSKMVLSFKSLLHPLDNQTGHQKVAITQCTASALTRRIVLTAAHCLNGENPSYVEIMEGTTVTTIPVVKTTVIDEFKTDAYADIALAVLKEDLPASTITVSIPNPDMQIDLQKLDLISAGYGKDTDAPGADLKDGLGVLRVVLLKISGYEFSDSKFLVDQSNGKGFCQGDSGGPGLFKHQDKYYVMGVASKTVFPEEHKSSEATIATCSFRGAYVNLLKFKTWIEKTTATLTAEIEASTSTTATETSEPMIAADQKLDD